MVIQPLFSLVLKIGRISMKHHVAFLKFEAVLNHCQRRCDAKTIEEAVAFGYQRDWFDNHNRLTASGDALAEIIMQSLDLMFDADSTCH